MAWKNPLAIVLGLLRSPKDSDIVALTGLVASLANEASSPMNVLLSLVSVRVPHFVHFAQLY